MEAQVRELFLRAGWSPAKTDSGLVTRGTGRVPRGHLPIDFPDLTMLHALPGSVLWPGRPDRNQGGQATGRLRDSQVQQWQALNPHPKHWADQERRLAHMKRDMQGFVRRA